MHILLVVWQYRKGAIGGTCTITDTWTAAYHRQGHQVSILSLDDAHGDGGPNASAGGWIEEPGPPRIFRTRIWQSAVIPPDPLSAHERKTFSRLIDRIRPDAALVVNNAFVGIDLLSELVALRVPTLIMTYDVYSFTCLNLYLVRADGSRCDGKLIPRICAACSSMGVPLADGSRLLSGIRRAGFEFFRRFPIQGAIPSHPRIQHSLRRARGKLEMLERFAAMPLAFVANNRMHCEVLAMNGIPREKIVYSPMGLDLPKARVEDLPLPCTQEGGSGTFTFGYVGRCSHEGGLAMLLSAFAKVKSLCPGSRLKLYTRFDNAFDLQVNARNVRRCRRLAESLPGVTVSSERVADDLRGAYGSIDVLVIPCRWINDGSRVCSEALAMARPPIIGSYTSMTDWVVDGHNGLFFDGSTDGLADVMANAARNPQRVVEMSRNCHIVRTAVEEVSGYLEVAEKLRRQLSS